MENKKRKNDIKSFYVPLLAILVIMAGIVAIVTSVREAKEEASRVEEEVSKTDIPVVAEPSVPSKVKKPEIIPETEDTEVVSPTTEETEKVETEPAAVEDEPATPVFIAPVSGIVTKGFSDTVPVFSETMNDYRVHTGIDISGEVGEAVLASAAGTVGAIWDDPLMGKCMTIVHPGEFVTTYKGLYEILPEGIAQGVEVEAGQPIAALGESALIEVSEEPHVHFEMTKAGVTVDPLEYVAITGSVVYEE